MGWKEIQPGSGRSHDSKPAGVQPPSPPWARSGNNGRSVPGCIGFLGAYLSGVVLIYRFLPGFLLVSAWFLPVHAAPESFFNKEIQLEVFERGEASGFNAVYKGKTYTASLDADCVLSIQPQQAGEDVGNPIQLWFRVLDAEGYSPLELLKLDKKTKPVIQPKKIGFSGICQDKVRFGLDVAFSEDSVTVSGQLHRGERERPFLVYTMRFPATQSLPVTASPDEIAKATDGSSLILTGEKLLARTYKFSEVVDSMHGVGKAVVTGSWGARKILVNVEKARAAKREGSYFNYSGVALYRGSWSVGRMSSENAPGGPLVLKIE
jgi:hypothetical protein